MFSRLEKIAGQNSSVITSGFARKGVLEPQYLDQLHAHYKQSNLKYASIFDEYKHAHNRALNARKKSQFPNKQNNVESSRKTAY